MSLGFLLFCAAPTAAYRRAARRRLQAHCRDGSVQVWRSTRTWQSQLAPSRPRHSAGVNLLMRYMEWSCALYRAVQEHGMSKAEAAVLVETIMWDVYQPVTAGPSPRRQAWSSTSSFVRLPTTSRTKAFPSSPSLRRVTWTTAWRANGA